MRLGAPSRASLRRGGVRRASDGRSLREARLSGRPTNRPRASPDFGFEALDDEAADPFDVLGVAPSDSRETVRAAFLALQKIHHPDVAGAAGLARSTQINVAFEALSDPEARAKLLSARGAGRDKWSRRRGAGSGAAAAYAPVRSREGMVGPLRSSLVAAVPLVSCGGDTCDDDDALGDVSHALRQWAATLPFTADVALPVPLRVDALPDGVRISFVGSPVNGRLTVLGELFFIFSVDADTREHSVAVTRAWPAASWDGRPLPGEDRVIASFLREAAFVQKPPEEGEEAQGPFGLPSWLSFVFAALPVGLGLSGPKGGEYAAYNIKRLQPAEEQRRQGAGGWQLRDGE